MEKLSTLGLNTIGIVESERGAQIPKHIYDVSVLLKAADPAIITRMATVYPEIVNYENSFREDGKKHTLQAVTDDIPASLKTLLGINSYSLVQRQASMHNNFVHQLLPTINNTVYKPTDHVNDIQTVRLLGCHLQLMVHNLAQPSDVGQGFGQDLKILNSFGNMDINDKRKAAEELLNSIPAGVDRKYAKNSSLEQIYLHKRIVEIRKQLYVGTVPTIRDSLST